MENEPLNVKLLVALGDRYFGPIDFNMWRHQQPVLLTAPGAMDEPLELPAELRTGAPRVLYSRRRNRVLRPDQDYHAQEIENGDVLLLTDQRDESLIGLVAKTVMEQTGTPEPNGGARNGGARPPNGGRQPPKQSFLARLAEHPLVVAVVGGIGAAVGAAVILALIFGTP